jgi:hypothetical protein
MLQLFMGERRHLNVIGVVLDLHKNPEGIYTLHQFMRGKRRSNVMSVITALRESQA